MLLMLVASEVDLAVQLPDPQVGLVPAVQVPVLASCFVTHYHVSGKSKGGVPSAPPMLGDATVVGGLVAGDLGPSLPLWLVLQVK